MDTYIEISFLTNMLIGIMMLYASGCYTHQRMNHMLFLFALIGEQVLLMLSLYLSLWVLFIIYEIAFYLLVFYYAWKRMLLFLCLRYLAYATLFKFSGGSFHMGHYFVPAQNQMIGFCLLSCFLIFLLKQKWESYFMVSEFIYPLTIYTPIPIHVRGFLDSGNQVMLEGLPVLFLDERYRTQLDNDSSTACTIHTIHSEARLSCFLYEVKIGRNKKRSCYICCDKKVVLEWGCQCLLNLNL